MDRGSLLKDRLALPGVEREVKGIETQDTKVLMNQDFTLAALKEALHRQAYTALHIASHGFIGKTSDQSFVIAYDNVINFNDLYSVLLEAQRHSSPLKLLTLSACHTAEGDDRTPLGLSGMAIRAKVSSALGSLWPVDDNATAQLMPLFYQELQSNGGHTAKALRAAQMAMIKEPRYQHPYYWAAFTLVGQWW
ncbi:MAG: CHAT domain-containing protein [Gammaproteobacteria bacterium]|nr:CHAT domain-containing protein [Gammaproteobacteria bacterium]